MSLFLSYILLGLSLAAPIGPVNAAQMDRGIRVGFWNAWLLGLGSLTADLVFLGVVFFGTIHFLETPIIKTFLWLFGSFVLIYSGIDAFKGAGELVNTRSENPESLAKSFGTGFFLSLSNPLSIMFWLGIYGSVLAETATLYGTKELLLYTAAIIFGLLIWDFAMALLASTFKRFLTQRLIQFISYSSAASLIGFGLYFGWQAYQVFFR